MHTHRGLALISVIFVSAAVTVLVLAAEPQPQRIALSDVAVAPRLLAAVKPKAPAPQVDVVFVLDTTASMSGLIDSAKRKVWSVANKIAAGQPEPDVRFGLVAFRDKGDDYITRTVALSEDPGEVYQQLSGLAAGGGGDGPEHVNRGLYDAIHGMQWRDGNTLKLIFLVGDAPPHDDYDDVPTSRELAVLARQHNIVINTLRCGGDALTELAWRAIAEAGGGKFASIAHDGGAIAVATPYDEELARLGVELADTAVTYGAADDRRRAEGAREARKAMAAPAAADAASFAAKKGGYVGSKDLLYDTRRGRVAVESLPATALPAELASKSASEKRAWIAEKAAKRAALTGRIEELSAKRDAHVEAEEANDGGDSFDGNVVEMLREQAATTGIGY